MKANLNGIAVTSDKIVMLLPVPVITKNVFHEITAGTCRGAVEGVV